MPSPFTRPLRLEYLDGFDWELLEEFDFASEAAERLICVPKGFRTDFASVPRLLWRLLPPTGKYGKAAVVHDFCYRTSGFCPKAIADRVFLEGMTVLEVPWWKRTLMYWAVRLFGGRAYKGAC